MVKIELQTNVFYTCMSFKKTTPTLKSELSSRVTKSHSGFEIVSSVQRILRLDFPVIDPQNDW